MKAAIRTTAMTIPTNMRLLLQNCGYPRGKARDCPDKRNQPIISDRLGGIGRLGNYPDPAAGSRWPMYGSEWSRPASSCAPAPAAIGRFRGLPGKLQPV